MAVASAGPYANQTDNHASTSSLNFLQAGCSSWHSIKCQSTDGKSGNHVNLYTGVYFWFSAKPKLLTAMCTVCHIASEYKLERTWWLWMMVAACCRPSTHVVTMDSDSFSMSASCWMAVCTSVTRFSSANCSCCQKHHVTLNILTVNWLAFAETGPLIAVHDRFGNLHS